MARTDKSMLQALLDPDISDKLTEPERHAFLDMSDRLAGRQSSLTPKQHEWVQRVFLKMHLDAEEPSENLVSSGRVKPDTSGRVYAFENQPRPLKPPGR